MRAPPSAAPFARWPPGWQIAELVATGRTNRQIAAALFLSRKTVESHLSRMFGKLSISSRAGLAPAVERFRACRRTPFGASTPDPANTPGGGTGKIQGGRVNLSDAPSRGQGQSESRAAQGVGHGR
ncbi:response regulator transcription factor [Streptomyces sp. NPDC002845]